MEPVLADLFARARHVREVRLVNGLVSGNLSTALAGEDVGTVLHA